MSAAIKLHETNDQLQNLKAHNTDNDCKQEHETVEILLQKLGDKWYAFWEIEGNIYYQNQNKVIAL